MTIKNGFIVLLWVAVASSTTWAQGPAKARDEVLARIERVRGDEDVCFLVKHNGAYHLERVGRFADAMTSDVYEGVLPANGVSDLEGWLNSDELRRLTQQQIASTPKNNEPADMVLLNFRREGSWYNLNFFTADRRKLVAKTLDPLTAWIDAVAVNRPGAQKVATGPTRCSSSPDAARAVAEQSKRNAERAKPKFIMRVFLDRLDLRDGREVRTCALVYRDGRFRFENSDQPITETWKPRIYEGLLSSDELQVVQRLLDAPDLKAKTSGPEPKRAAAQEEFEMGYLVVPRADSVQNLNLSTNEDLRVVQPIREWMAAAMQGHKAAELKDAKPTACYPPEQ